MRANVSLQARGLYFTIQSIWNEHDLRPCCWLRTERLAAACGVSLPSLRRYRRELEAANWIEVERSADGRILLYRAEPPQNFFIPACKNFSPPYNMKKSSKTENTQTARCVAPVEQAPQTDKPEGTDKPQAPTAKPEAPPAKPQAPPAELEDMAEHEAKREAPPAEHGDIPASTLRAIEDQIAAGMAAGNIRCEAAYRKQLHRLAAAGQYQIPELPPSARMRKYEPEWLRSNEPNCRNSAEERAVVKELCRSFLNENRYKNGALDRKSNVFENLRKNQTCTGGKKCDWYEFRD